MCVQINDRCEFPFELSLDEYLAEHVRSAADPQDFVLHSVLVHEGALTGITCTYVSVDAHAHVCTWVQVYARVRVLCVAVCASA